MRGGEGGAQGESRERQGGEVKRKAQLGRMGR